MARRVQRPPARPKPARGGFPVGLLALVLIGLDMAFPGRALGVVGVVAMVAWSVRLLLSVFGRLGSSTTKGTDLVIQASLVALVVARGYVLVQQFEAGEESDALVQAIRTYDGIYTVLALACVASSAMPERFARLALVLSRRPALLLSGSFVALIAVGTFMLTLPFSVRSLAQVSFIDALFTITSAVCVTGLTVNDVPTVYSRFGHGVILLSIQLGGIGIMTIAALALTFGRNSALSAQLQYASMMDARTISDLRSTVRGIVFGTFAIEAGGALLLWVMFTGDDRVGNDSPVFLAVFHAVSAFCNAGFSLFDGNLTKFADAPAVQLVIMGLIVLGGLGFPVIGELVAHAWARVHRLVRRDRPPPPRLSLGSRVVLSTTAILVVGGALVLGILEAQRSFGHLPWGQRIWAALFASVNTRTSGFNTVDIAAMGEAALLCSCVLMFIGGSPGSTAGGIKTTTAATILATLRGELAGREPRLGNRSIAPEIFRRATAVAALSTAFVLVALLALTLTESMPFHKLLFETVSAFATVGLSAGVTPDLSVIGKLIVIATMFVGRVGPLTIALAVASMARKEPYRLASESLPIG